MNSKHYAILSTVLYGLIVAAAMRWGVVEYSPQQPKEAELFVEFIEPKPEPEPPKPKPQPKPVVAPKRQKQAVADNSQQASGKQEKVQTVNQKALFKMNKSGVDEPQNAGNPMGEQSDKEQSTGTGGGLNPVGTDALDEGLQGRGLVGALPMPSYPAGNRGGKVVVRVAVDKSGKVTSATYEPKGSTTSDKALIDAAISAAKKARFTESAAFIQGGTITYIFKLKASE